MDSEFTILASFILQNGLIDDEFGLSLKIKCFFIIIINK